MAETQSFHLANLGGNCPVQAEGMVDGREFYFRARGDFWSICIGGADVIMAPEWRYGETFGQWPDAGWMSFAEARGFIIKAVKIYREGKRRVMETAE